MTRITLTQEQTAQLEGATFPIVLVDARGRQFQVSPSSGWTAEELADMERWIDSDETGVPFDRIMAKIRAREQAACDTP